MNSLLQKFQGSYLCDWVLQGRSPWFSIRNHPSFKMESTRCGINLTVWWEESQMSKQWCFRINPPVVKIQTLKIYESVIGSIKLSLVVSSCVPQGEFPLLVRLVLLHWNYGFPSCFFSLGKKPREFFHWQTLRRYAWRSRCSCSGLAHVRAMYWAVPQFQESFTESLTGLELFVRGPLGWCGVSCLGVWKMSGGKSWCDKVAWVFPNKFGGAQICWWWWRCSKDGLSTGYFLWGRGHQGFKKIGYHMTKRQVKAWKKHGMIGQRNCLPSGPCRMVFCFVGILLVSCNQKDHHGFFYGKNGMLCHW